MNRADRAYLETIARVRGNIRRVPGGDPASRYVIVDRGDGIELGLAAQAAAQRVGVCIPGGAAAYPSSLLMTVVPAQAAGVAEIAVVVPPTPFGGFNTDLLAACHALGVTEVYRIGGAQGVASLAFGLQEIGLTRSTRSSARATSSSRWPSGHVFGTVDIDSIAGPSEVVVIADGSAVPRYLAADLISQAEHSPGASILVTWEPADCSTGRAGAGGPTGSAEPRRPGPRQPGAVRGDSCLHATRTRRLRSPI